MEIGQRLKSSVLACLGLIGAVVAFGPAPALAQSSRPSTYDDPYADGVLDELKVGLFDHDVRAFGGREKGVDFNGELLLHPFISDALASNLPWFLRWTAQPRPEIGFEANSAGDTNQFYFGFDWTWLVARDLFNPGQDGLTLGISFGPGFNDGKIRSTLSDRKSLGSHILFRVSGEVGYQITPKYDVSVYLDHISNGGFAKYNDSINDLGVRFGYKF